IRDRNVTGVQTCALPISVINMDTIAGLDGDTPESFADTISRLIALAPENITVHTLAIKRGADLSDRAGNAARHDAVRQMLDFAKIGRASCRGRVGARRAR